MKASSDKRECQKCNKFRKLPLHLHELYMFCELLENTHSVYKYSNKSFKKETTASTVNIAKWLRLASQIESIEMNPFRYEESHLWCGPVVEKLDSDADHHSAIITPLTQFIYIANALEETYRFTSPLYKTHYESLKIETPKLEQKRNYSVQASWLLDEVFSKIDIPTHYNHKVDNFLSLAKKYQSSFNVTFDVELKNNGNLSYGLSLVRNIRNHIAHAIFPIIENPEYTFEFSNPQTKCLIINLLGYASRVAAMNIQILLNISNDGFKSAGYSYLFDNPYCDKIESLFSMNYLNKLHIEQEFGLNESAQWQLHSKLDEN